MWEKLTSHRIPSAGVTALTKSNFRSMLIRTTSFLLLLVLVFPPMFGTAPVANAKGSSLAPLVPAAAPEPFRVSTTAFSLPVIGSVASVMTSKIGDIVAEPTLPPGFEAGKVPGFTERLTTAITSSFAFFAHAKKSSIASALAPAPPSGTVLFDFDEDGKADIGRWQGSDTEFKVRNSSDGNYTTHIIGSSSAIAAPGDFDGDGKTDAAVFNAGSWTIKKSSTGSTQNTSWGTTGDRPVAADYDGDGATDIAIFRPSTSTWWILKSSDSNYYAVSHGASGDLPITGNWDGDSYADVAVYRPSNGYWYVLRSTAGSLAVAWGAASDIPAPADFDGDNKTDLAVYRPSTGTWWIMKSSTGFDGTHVGHTWGNYGDQPAPADYDGDGEADLAVWRPKTGVWYIAKSSADNEDFEYYSLGLPGNTAIPSAYLQQVGVTVYGDDMANARLSPKNATGGTNLYSRNFSWGTSLVGLPGRAGLDAGFGISYNSLVWTKLGSEMHFDVDQSNVSPGFRIGFPTIEPPYYNEVTSKWSFLMVTPSGGRVEFRNTAVTNYYETADSSYTQLWVKSDEGINTPIEEIPLLVTTADGTMMSYEWIGGAYRCTQIKDRNGNFITVAYDEDGTLQTMTDTLGRVVTVHYDGQLYPTSITQTWKTNNGVGTGTEEHVWASFSYTTKTVSTNFGSLTVVGPPNSTVVKVLEKVTYPDLSYTKFTHNSYLQVEKVENFARDAHLLNHVRTDLDAVSGTQSDCPRFGSTHSKIDNFNMVSGVAQEIKVTNTLATGQSYSLGGITGSATRIEVKVDGHSELAFSRTYIAASGWNEGLTIGTEDCTGTTSCDQKRWTWTDWTQDNESVSYMLNPRVKETRVGDASNTKKTKIYYYEPTTGVFPFGLPEKVEIYDGTSVLKTETTNYNLGTSYTSRRIIGLPLETKLFAGTSSGTLMSKVTYAYDEGTFGDTELSQSITPTQHDSTYGSTFISGRGNLTSIKRWDTNFPTTVGVTSSMKYNTAGSVVSRTDPMSRTIKIGYSDVWNDGVTRSTYAYPTTVTDPAGSAFGDSAHSSTVMYRYDIGANVEAVSPAPTGESYGKKTKRKYDSVGRLERDSIYLNTTEYSYTRYQYPYNGIQSQMFSTVVDVDDDGNADMDDEVLSEAWTDGAGRVRWSRTEHPGSTGGWAATRTEYDIVGRVKRSSVPTEISAVSATNPDSWIPAGDDYRGMSGSEYVWLWNQQEYDWKGRVVRKVSTDGNPATSNDSDILISYEGCGCAGGQVTTIQGENIVETDWQGNNPTTLGRRKQKIYEDILGRTIKTETFDWAGTSVYSTTTNSYNARDQITDTTQYAGTTSGTSRSITMTYDGYGRMATRHYPIEDTGADTSWTYNADDSIATITDPRGVITNFSYYSATGLLHEMTYAVPSSQASAVDDTPDVTFSYDNLGNRTSMTDGTGSVSYVYNALSRLESETRTISGLSGNFPINYTYTLSGTVKTFSNPQNSSEVATYNFDKVGRPIGVERSGGSIHSTKFRAWGAIKEYRTSGSSTSVYAYDKFSYDTKLNISQYARGSNAGDGEVSDYQRYADGTVKYTVAKNSPTSDNPTFDRRFRYDSVGRLIQGQSGFEANGRTDLFVETPYRNNISYNAFSEMESSGSSSRHWEHNVYPMSYTIGGSTGRVSTSGYDASGNLTSERMEYTPTVINRTMKYDAAGRNVYTHDPIIHPSSENDHVFSVTFDGNGWRVKKVDTSDPPGTPPSFSETEYEFRSTALGGEAVGKLKVFSWSSTQESRFITPINGVEWGDRVAWSAPEGIKTYGEDGAQLDTRGADVGEENPYNTGDGGTGYPATGGDPTSMGRCAEGGIPQSCDAASRFNDLANRIDNLLWGEKPAPTDKGQTNKAADSKGGSSEAKETTKTDKPKDKTENAGILNDASIPNSSGDDDEDDDTIYGPADSRLGSSKVFTHIGTDVVDASEGSSIGSVEGSSRRRLEGGPDLMVCVTLGDLLNNYTFTEAAKRAWDRSFEGGRVAEQGTNYFWNPQTGSFSSSDRQRNSRSFFMPWDPERAKQIATANNIYWVASLHTHPWRHKQKMPDGSTALTPWAPSPAEEDGSGDLGVSETSGIYHILLFPNLNSFDVTVYKGSTIIEKKYWDRFVLKCGTRKTNA